MAMSLVSGNVRGQVSSAHRAASRVHESSARPGEAKWTLCWEPATRSSEGLGAEIGLLPAPGGTGTASPASSSVKGDGYAHEEEQWGDERAYTWEPPPPPPRRVQRVIPVKPDLGLTVAVAGTESLCWHGPATRLGDTELPSDTLLGRRSPARWRVPQLVFNPFILGGKLRPTQGSRSKFHVAEGGRKRGKLEPHGCLRMHAPRHSSKGLLSRGRRDRGACKPVRLSPFRCARPPQRRLGSQCFYF